MKVILSNFKWHIQLGATIIMSRTNQIRPLVIFFLLYFHLVTWKTFLNFNFFLLHIENNRIITEEQTSIEMTHLFTQKINRQYNSTFTFYLHMYCIQVKVIHFFFYFSDENNLEPKLSSYYCSTFFGEKKMLKMFFCKYFFPLI